MVTQVHSSSRDDTILYIEEIKNCISSGTRALEVLVKTQPTIHVKIRGSEELQAILQAAVNEAIQNDNRHDFLELAAKNNLLNEDFHNATLIRVAKENKIQCLTALLNGFSLRKSTVNELMNYFIDTENLDGIDILSKAQYDFSEEFNQGLVEAARKEKTAALQKIYESKHIPYGPHIQAMRLCAEQGNEKGLQILLEAQFPQYRNGQPQKVSINQADLAKIVEAARPYPACVQLLSSLGGGAMV